MRASRLLSLLLLLQIRGRMTAAQLAGELEVSVRTVYRDVEALSAAGVPVYGEAGRDGGYRLVDGCRTRLTGLTGDEAEVLLLGGLPGAAAELGLGTALATAELKLLAALPEPLRDRAQLVRERFHLDAPSWYRDAESVPYLTAVADAVWEQRSVRMRYRRWRAPTDVNRVVDPLGLVLKAGRWYLVARSGAQVRTYRVGQILSADVLTTSFTRPDGFDLAEHWHRYVAAFDARRHHGTAAVRLSPRGVERLPDLMDPAIVRAVQQTARPDIAGWLRACVPIESLEHSASELLRLGADIEVLAPVELRERIAAIAAELARMYRSERYAVGALAASH